MWNYWRTRNGLIRVKLAISRLIPYVIEDLRGGFINQLSNLLRPTGIHAGVKNLAIKLGIVKVPESTIVLSAKSPDQQLATPTSKPLIFVSACVDETSPGDWKYSGGIKELNYLVKLLRIHGYEAYMVTYNGVYEPWLIEHQPHISLEEFRSQISSTSNVRCITSLATASAFIRECPNLYFWDMELAVTDYEHFPVLANLYHRKIRNTACISRTIQAWHMAHFRRSCTLLPNLLDESLWSPLPSQRQSHRIGYMNEGLHTEAYLAVVRDAIQEKGLDLEFQQLQGTEADILAGMRSCEVFLSMNSGKDPLWGEGCPRTVIEALATGCVVIAFDLMGNRETIQDNFNSILVPRHRPDLMAAALVRLYTFPGERDRLRTNAFALIQSCHTFEARWTAVKEFLHL